MGRCGGAEGFLGTFGQVSGAWKTPPPIDSLERRGGGKRLARSARWRAPCANSASRSPSPPKRKSKLPVENLSLRSLNGAGLRVPARAAEKERSRVFVAGGTRPRDVLSPASLLVTLERRPCVLGHKGGLCTARIGGRNCCKKLYGVGSPLYINRTSVGEPVNSFTFKQHYIFKRCAWFLSPASLAVSANNQLGVLCARQLGPRLVLYICDRVLDWDREKTGKRVSITAKIRDLGLENYNRSPIIANDYICRFL